LLVKRNFGRKNTRQKSKRTTETDDAGLDACRRRSKEKDEQVQRFEDKSARSQEMEILVLQTCQPADHLRRRRRRRYIH
jgi:hypothetical protein